MIGVATTGPTPSSTAPASPSATPATRASRATVCSTKMSRGRHSRPAARARATTCIDRDAVAAEVEERVVDPDPLQPEDLGVDAGQDLLDRVGRGAVTIAVAGIPVPAGRGCRVCR